jgi:hypothetical protein
MVFPTDIKQHFRKEASELLDILPSAGIFPFHFLDEEDESSKSQYEKSPDYDQGYIHLNLLLLFGLSQTQISLTSNRPGQSDFPMVRNPHKPVKNKG